MPVRQIHIDGYRSIADLRLNLGPVTVVTGPNGAGKSNLYRAIVLLASAATGQLARTLAEEGGMPSVLWAGGKRAKGGHRVALGVTIDAWRLEIGLGLAPSAHDTRTGLALTEFVLDPEVKDEEVSLGEPGRARVKLVERDRTSARLRDVEGARVDYPGALAPGESILSQLREPHRFPELSALREELLRWRFYHHFRTDRDAPSRAEQVGVRTPVLDAEGRDLAAALRTIIEMGDGEGLLAAVRRALGAELQLRCSRGRFAVDLRVEALRPFTGSELSDGTLRYLCLLAALMSPDPPPLLALNEPETSLAPELLPPLAERIVAASRRSQLWVTTHSETLVREIERLSGARPIRLSRVEGVTRVEGLRIDGTIAPRDEEA